MFQIGTGEAVFRNLADAAVFHIRAEEDVYKRQTQALKEIRPEHPYKGYIVHPLDQLRKFFAGKDDGYILNGIVQGRHTGIAFRDGKLRRELACLLYTSELRSPGAALFFLGLHRICIFCLLYTSLCQGKGRGLSFNLRVYIQLQFLDKFWDHRSISSLHIQSDHCKSDSPALTADTYCLQPRSPRRWCQWQSCSSRPRPWKVIQPSQHAWTRGNGCKGC